MVPVGETRPVERALCLALDNKFLQHDFACPGGFSRGNLARPCLDLPVECRVQPVKDGSGIHGMPDNLGH